MVMVAPHDHGCLIALNSIGYLWEILVGGPELLSGFDSGGAGNRARARKRRARIRHSFYRTANGGASSPAPFCTAA